MFTTNNISSTLQLYKNDYMHLIAADVPLTQNGEADARDAGTLLRDRGMKFDVTFTSNLERAWYSIVVFFPLLFECVYLFVSICLSACVTRRTAAIIMASSGQSNVEVIRSWRLNERHYGMLQGHKKNCPKLARAFGEDLLMEWRKSYHTPPPSIDDEEAMQKLGRESRTMSTSLMDPRYVETSPYENHRNRFLLLLSFSSFLFSSSFVFVFPE